jgi:2-polyprenyl-3-methyl-5-hydroxy-6-metoxy-1,4-benzoquinol methylase
MDGRVHPAYANPRPEVTPLVPPDAHRVLDVGCSTGHLGAALRAKGHSVTGIEADPMLAAEARERLDTVVEADVETLVARGVDPGGPFDCVVCADVLEHLRDPWAVVAWAEGLLAPGGSLVVSVPNIRHLQTLWNVVVRRRWPYRSVGIFDRTHLRFFARENLQELLSGTSLEIVDLRRSYRLRDDEAWRGNRYAHHLGDFGTLQFIFRARRPGTTSPEEAA